MLSFCPVCDIVLPLLELERHVNNHFVEDEVAADAELAQKIALESDEYRVQDDEKMDYERPSDVSSQSTIHINAATSCHLAADFVGISDQEKMNLLVRLQIKSSFHIVEAGLMALLMKCLESENKNWTSVVSGHIDHYQSIRSEDSGWGCGWRNIQMMSSHLLMLRQESREVLFGGSGYVPDIPSLQRWLEIAWERGFDVTGSNSFDSKIYGSRRWIGTTECAALFRSFGLRARIIDFDSFSSSSPATSNSLGEESFSGGKRTMKKVYGPMDRFLQKRKCDFQERSKEKSWHEESSVECRSNKNEENVKGHQVLMEWVWDYFTGGKLNVAHVLVSERTPLYFQHDGHSRTVIGIQKQQGMRGSQDRFSLLVLDPAQRTAELERSLINKYGWQRLIKRGVHTLRKPQYQLCYVDPGIAKGEELEQLKSMDSVYVKF